MMIMMMMIPTMMNNNNNNHHHKSASTTSMPSHLLFSFFFFTLLFLTQPCHSTTIVVDGVSPWTNPSVFVGDSVIFQHKYGYSLYIFQSFNAFTLCNFSQATRLTNPNSSSHSYSWHTSRPGFFYFAFSDGSSSSSSCDQKYSQKLAIKVSAPAPAPAPEFPSRGAPASPISGGVVSSSPAYPWPFQPREKSVAAWAPAPEPSAGGEGGVYGGASAPMRVPKKLPDKGGEMPFINSNPAVPLPTGEVDSATIRPMPTSASAGHQQMMRWQKGLLGAEMVGAYCSVLFLLMWLWM